MRFMDAKVVVSISDDLDDESYDRIGDEHGDSMAHFIDSRLEALARDVKREFRTIPELEVSVYVDE